MAKVLSTFAWGGSEMEMVKMLEMLKTALRRGHKKHTELAGGQGGGQVVRATSVSLNGPPATPSHE